MSHTFKTKRVVNPLNPVYELPSCVVEKVPPPKFIRDAHSCDDINKQHPKRELNIVGVIDKSFKSFVGGAETDLTRSMRHRQLKSKRESNMYGASGGKLNTGDVKTNMRRSRNPQTNPLDPEYRIHDQSVGFIKGSKPKKLHKYIKV